MPTRRNIPLEISRTFQPSTSSMPLVIRSDTYIHPLRSEEACVGSKTSDFNLQSAEIPTSCVAWKRIRYGIRSWVSHRTSYGWYDETPFGLGGRHAGPCLSQRSECWTYSVMGWRLGVIESERSRECCLMLCKGLCFRKPMMAGRIWSWTKDSSTVKLLFNIMLHVGSGSWELYVCRV